MVLGPNCVLITNTDSLLCLYCFQSKNKKNSFKAISLQWDTEIWRFLVFLFTLSTETSQLYIRRWMSWPKRYLNMCVYYGYIIIRNSTAACAMLLWNVQWSKHISPSPQFAKILAFSPSSMNQTILCMSTSNWDKIFPGLAIENVLYCL